MYRHFSMSLALFVALFSFWAICFLPVICQLWVLRRRSVDYEALVIFGAGPRIIRAFSSSRLPIEIRWVPWPIARIKARGMGLTDVPPQHDDTRHWQALPRHVQAAVWLAAPLGGLVLATLLNFSGSVGLDRTSATSQGVTVAYLAPEAWGAGQVLENDRILAIDGVALDSSSLVKLASIKRDIADREVTIELVRDSKLRQVTLVGPSDPDHLWGWQFGGSTRASTRSLGEHAVAALRSPWSFYAAQLGIAAPASQVGIYQAMLSSRGQDVGSRVFSYLQLAGVLAAHFALLLALPFPFLPGGRLAILAWEALHSGKPLSPNTRRFLQRAGWVVFFLLFVLAQVANFIA